MSELTKIQHFKKAPGNIDKAINTIKYPCMYPGCNETAISSHSQQKEGALRAIAKEGRVYGLRKSMYHMLRHIIDGKENLPLTEINISKASSFDGYCNYHDREIFSSIERKPLNVNNENQAAIFFLRAISHEIASKRKNIILMEMLRNEIGKIAKYQDDDFWLKWIEGLKYFLIREASFIFNQIIEMLRKRQYSCLHVSWVRIQQKLPFSLSTTVSPWINEYSNKWSPDFDKPQAIASFSVVPTMIHTDIVCSWLDYCHEDSKWIGEEMATTNGLEKIINLLGFSETEDFCINIDFWESQPQDIKEFILYNMRHAAFRGPTTTVPHIIKLADRD